MNIVDRAIALGLPVFPCRADKTPGTPHGFKDAVVGADNIRSLFRRYPGSLIGVSTGKPSGLFILDIDCARHPEAGEWLIQHKHELPATREHRSLSGGAHFLFKHRDDLHNSAGKLCRGVDTRGDRGYCIWWPAHAPQDNHKLNLPIVDIPDWLYLKLTEQPHRSICPPSLSHISLAPIRVRGILKTAAAAREGERNQTLFWCANRLHDMARWGEIDHAGFIDACQQLEQAAITVGLSGQEAARTIASAMRPRS